MVDYVSDLSRYGYGSGFGSVGAVATPYLAGYGSSMGASDPTAAYLQSAGSPVSGISGTGNGANSDLSSILGYGQNIYPNAPGASNSGGFLGLGVSGLDFGKLALGGLQTIGSLWQAYEANKLAKAQFNFQKEFAQKNLANQIQSYNTTLEDRINSRYVTEGKSAADAASYIDSHKLPA